MITRRKLLFFQHSRPRSKETLEVPSMSDHLENRHRPAAVFIVFPPKTSLSLLWISEIRKQDAQITRKLRLKTARFTPSVTELWAMLSSARATQHAYLECTWGCFEMIWVLFTPTSTYMSTFVNFHHANKVFFARWPQKSETFLWDLAEILLWLANFSDYTRGGAQL